MGNNKATSLTDWNGLFEELNNESPRSAVIIASAFLDAQLRAILINTLIDSPKEVNSYLESDLQNFATRISLAFCMGLISEDTYHDLNVIRRIRNKFAHEMHAYSFDEPKIVDLCRSLISSKLITEETCLPKNHGSLFLLGVTQLVMWLGLIIIQTDKHHALIPKNHEHVQVVNSGSNNHKENSQTDKGTGLDSNLKNRTIKLNELIEYAKTIDGKKMVTKVKQKYFQFSISDSGFHYLPQSTNKPRIQKYYYIERVLEKFNETRSMTPSDYQDITMNASYFLAILDSYLNLYLGNQPNI